MVDSHIEIRNGLCLNALRSINYQQGPFTGSYRTTNLIREVNMSWSIYQVQDIGFTLIVVFHLDSVTLDGNTTFTLQIHIIKHLALCYLNGLSIFQQTVGQGTLTMVNMRNDTEVSYMIHQLFVILQFAKLQKNQRKSDIFAFFCNFVPKNSIRYEKDLDICHVSNPFGCLSGVTGG